jgi:hypothetical protein
MAGADNPFRDRTLRYLGLFFDGCLVRDLARLIRNEDEFAGRVHRIALANAFAATGILLYAADLAQNAALLGYIPLTHIWISMGVVWWLSIVLTSRYSR